MKQIKYTNALFYYDGLQVFEARDLIGGHYVGILTPPIGTSDQYLVAGVSPENLRQFRSGSIDLRSLLIDSDKDERYVATVDNGLDNPLKLTELRTSTIDDNLLPERGYVLHDRSTDDYVLREARERNNLILELTVEPPEATLQHRIRASSLAEMLLRVQAMIRHAFSAQLKDYPTRIRLPHDDMMDVIVPAARGSFRIVLEAATLPDLLGSSRLGKALELIDVFFQNTDDPEVTLATARDFRGHLAGSYLKLLQFLEKQQTSLRYSWAEPNFTRPSRQWILHGETRSLVEVLSSVTDLGHESVTLEGAFESFNRASGSWGLLTREGKRIGKIKDDGPSLDGLEVGGRYIFHCDEIIEEARISGRELRTLFLFRHESASEDK